MRVWLTQIGYEVAVFSEEPHWNPRGWERLVPDKRCEFDVCAGEAHRLGVGISHWPKVTEMELTAKFVCEWEPIPPKKGWE